MAHLEPKRFDPHGILHQFAFDAVSATLGFSHNALLAMTEANITRADDLMLSTKASATKSPANFNSWRQGMIFPWSAPSHKYFSILMVHPEMALPTVAVVIAGLQALHAVEYAFKKI